MGLLSLLFRDPIAFLLLVPLLLYSVIAHEVAHGWVASLFGDNTAKYSGRLSFNPKFHLDPMGSHVELLTLQVPVGLIILGYLTIERIIYL